MKVSKVYEVWTGGDMVEDFIYDRDAAIRLAREEVREQAKHPDPAEVIVDEIIHYELLNDNDVNELDETI